MNKIKKIISKLFGKYNSAHSVGYVSNGGVTSVYVTKNSEEKQKEFNEWLNKVAGEIKPCGKSIEELELYLVENYKAEMTEVSAFNLKVIKSNIILGLFPELLTTPEIKLDYNKKPTKKQLEQFAHISDKRLNEAMEYPPEKLNLDICVYTFPFICENQEIGTFRINIERTTEQCNICYSCNINLSDEQKEAANKIVRDIDLFKGVTQSDIDNRTPRFMGYATTLMNYKRKF